MCLPFSIQPRGSICTRMRHSFCHRSGSRRLSESMLFFHPSTFPRSLEIVEVETVKLWML